jgi:predicted transcriptional regulator
MNWADKSLKILGLTLTETIILNTLEELKSVQQIAEDTSLSRTGINHAIKNLTDKGFIRSVTRGKRHFYIALSVDGLLENIQETLEEIGDLNKKGAKVKLTKEDEFIIHVGTKEIIPAYKRIAAENKNERIQAIQHHRSWSELIDKITPKELTEFNESIKKNKIILDGMLNRSAYDAYKKEMSEDPDKHKDAVKSLEGRTADYTVFPDEFFNYDSEIWIFKTTTLIINWKEEVAIEITNANMTGFLKDMFAFVKNAGNKLDHNQAIRDLISS